MRVLLVDIDSLRIDHLGCYGYSRDTSPTIDRLAEDGVHFEECYTSDSPCLPSRTALATGRHGAKSGVVTHYKHGQWYNEPGSGSSQDPERPLAFRWLSEHGVHTTSISSFSKRHLAYHFGASFRESIQPAASTGGELAEDVTGKATDWLERHATEDDWLLHVNYWDVHLLYHDVDEYLDPVRESGPPAPWPDQDTLDDQQRMTGSRTADLWHTPAQYRDETGEGDDSVWSMPAGFGSRADVEHVFDGYDASIRKVDAHIARLLESLESADVREETIVVVTADHGEAFGEHGLYGTHGMAHPACQQVPLVVSGDEVSGTGSGDGVTGTVYQFDLLATLCELMDVSVPAGWDAVSFTDALEGQSFAGRDHAVCGHGIRTFSRAVYQDEWVYIRLLHPGVFTYPGFYNDPDLPGCGLELLHDRSSDPHMTENLIHDEPEKAAELRGVHDAWLAEMVESPDTAGEDPLSRMATTAGPYMYLDPHDLLALYRELDYSEEKIQRVKWSLDRYPGPN